MPSTRVNWVAVGAVAAVAAAGIAFVALFSDRDGGCTVSGNNNDCTYQETVESIEAKREREVLEISARSADVPPKGDGPWPFVVAKTQGIGLKVRTTPTAEGVTINGLAELHTAWAVCRQNSGFDPDPATGNGPVWLKIKWDHQTPGSEILESDLSAKATGWAYGGYLVPVGHNGSIPPC